MVSASMTHQQPANDSPYWPACVHDPGFLPWLARFVTIVNNTRPDTPEVDLVRMAGVHGAVPPEWLQAVRFLMGETRDRPDCCGC